MKKHLQLLVIMTLITGMSAFGQSTKILDENFQDWDPTQDTDPTDCESGLVHESELTSNMSLLTADGEINIEVQMLMCGVAPECDSKRFERDGASSGDGVTVGYVSLSKIDGIVMSDLTVDHFGTDTDTLGQLIFGPISHIDSIRFAHSATGDNRGIRIFKSTDGENWERATDDEFNESDDSQAGDLRSVVIDEEDVYIKFTSGFGTDNVSQHARLHNIEIFGVPGEAPVSVSKVYSHTLEVVTLGNGKYRVQGNYNQMQVFDATGKMVDAGQHSESGLVDLNGLPAGIYILKVQDEAGSVATGKVIKY